MNQALTEPLAFGADALPCALLRFDARGRVRGGNARLLALLGRSRKQLLAARVDQLLTPGSAMFLHTYVLPLLQGHGQADEIGLELVHADGSVVPVLVSANRSGHGADAEISCAVLPAPRRASDERELQRARLEATQAREHLARANAELEAFAARAAHDLAEPVRKLQAFGERLAGSPRSQLDPADRDYLERMLKAAARMQALVDGLVGLSRSRTPAPPEAPRPLARVLAAVLDDLARHVAAAGADVRVGELPDVAVDPATVARLLHPLLDNALKFRREGVAHVVRIEGGRQGGDATGAEADPPRWWLAVHDNGTGFAPEQAHRLFEPFLRLHDKFKYPGAGLGLATSQRLAQALGGRIDAEGQAGEGARFTLTLPETP
jgi:signal transduction histidine kinase